MIEEAGIPVNSEFPVTGSKSYRQNEDGKSIARTSGADWTDQTLKVLIREMLPEAKILGRNFIPRGYRG